jgi:hypothetical protein
MTIIFHKTVAYARFSNQLESLPAVCVLEIMTNVSGVVQIPLTILTGAVHSSPHTRAITLQNKVIPRTKKYKRLDKDNNKDNDKEKDKDKDKEKDKKYSNSDVYTYDMGNVSSTTPLPIILVLSNPNPVAVVFTITGTSVPVKKVCYSHLQPGDVPGSSSGPVPGAAAGTGAGGAGMPSSDGTTTPQQKKAHQKHNKHLAQLPKLPCFYPCDLPCESSSDVIYYYSAPPGDSKDDESGIQFVMRPDSNISLNLFFENLTVGTGILDFSLQSTFQVKKYHYHYTAVEGELLNMCPPGQTNMLMGVRDSINIFSHSTFTGPIKLNSVHTTSPLMAVNLNAGGGDCPTDTDNDASIVYFTAPPPPPPDKKGE